MFRKILDINPTPGRGIHQKGDSTVVVAQNDITRAFNKVGINEGDTLMLHSSLSSMGNVIGGSEGFVGYVINSLGEKGTFCVPSFWWTPADPPLRLTDFDVKTSPGFNGAISETIRKRPDAYRSNNPSHSVAAIGKLASEITKSHGTYGFRPGPFGLNAFAEDSPWERLYIFDAWYGFIGVDLGYNTMAHYAEHLLFMDIFNNANVKDKEILINCISTPFYPFPGWWPYFSFEDMGERLEQEGLVKKTKIGSADFRVIRCKGMVDRIIEILHKEPENWFKAEHSKPFLNWL